MDHHEPAWTTALSAEKEKEYFKKLLRYVHQDSQQYPVYPSPENRFLALKLTPLSAVKVVILGQDPYHGPGQAHGLSFSVPESTPKPPSLKNIFKELSSDCQIDEPPHGCLIHWAKQGVLLLNTSLSVRHGSAGSHSQIGWEQFTDKVIKTISVSRRHVVFLLWGAHAQKKSQLIDKNNHCILTAPHPSPLSAHRGFLGCKHFSQTNNYLTQHNLEAIVWENKTHNEA